MLEYGFPMDCHKRNLFQLNTLPRLLYVREYKSLGDRMYNLQRHSQVTEIILIEVGCIRLNIGDKTYRANPGDIIIINANLPHRLVECTTPKFQALLLGIGNLYIHDLEPNTLVKKGANPIINCYKNVCQLPLYFHLCKELGIHGELDNLLDYQPHLTLISSLITVLYNLTITRANLGKNRKSIGLQVKEYIDDHYLEELNLKILAENLHLNQYYLAHSFKNFMGISPVQYIIKKRINEAQSMLLTTNLTITEIAFHCGYNNSNYFQTVFANYVGLTPGKYRQMWKPKK